MLAREDLAKAETKLQTANVMAQYALVGFTEKKARVPVYIPGEEKEKTTSLNFDAKSLQTCRKIASEVKQQLDQKGYAVHDNITGGASSKNVRNEIISLDSKGLLKSGQLGGGRNGSNLKYQLDYVRGDRIAWINGSEPNTDSIQSLILLMDRVMHCLANEIPSVKDRVIERQEAMATCYPGNGAKYIKHCDNPNKNGRVLTFIYYANPEWVKEHQGCLRIHHTSGPEDIPPLGDRLVVFYSDKRNPHEVLPCYKQNRYAVTVWYLDGITRQANLDADDQTRDQKERDKIQTEITKFKLERKSGQR